MSEIIVPTAAPAKVFDVFFHHIPNATFIFPNGRVAAFTGGRYATSDPAEAAYLQYEIDQGNQHIYRKADCLQLAQEDLAPDAEYRKHVIAEYLATEAAAKLNPPDMGEYEQGRLNPTTTTDIQEAAAGSDSIGASSISLAGLANLIPASK